MEEVLIDYDYILSELSTSDLEEIIKFLWEILPDKWCEKYQKMTPSITNILQFNDNGFEFLFDFSSELVTKGGVPSDQMVEDR